MAMTKYGVDYRIVEYDKWIVGINPERYMMSTPFISQNEKALWTNRYTLRLL